MNIDIAVPLRRLVACAALAAMVWGTPATQASPALASLHYLTEEYKPYNFTGEDGAPTGFAEIVLMGLASRPLALTRLEDAQRYTIGAVRSDVGEQLLLNAGFDEQKIMTANRLSQALRMLTSGRVDLVSSNKSTLLDLIKTQQLDPAQFEVRWMLSSEQYCFAFSHPVDDALVREFQLGLTQVLASSDFQQLQHKYFPSP